MKTPQQLWDKTAGYKTKSAAILLGLYQFVQLIAPNLMTGKTEEMTRQAIDLLIITGGVDWVYRNREKIITYLVNVFKRKNK